MRSDRSITDLTMSPLGGLMMLALAGTLMSCRPSVAVPELTPMVTAPVVRAGEPVQVEVEGAKPPFQFSIVSGLGQIDPNSGVFTAADEGGEVVIRTIDGDGRAKDIVLNTIGRLALLPQTALMRSGAAYVLKAKGGVPPYRFSIGSGPAIVDSLTGLLSVSGAGAVRVELSDSESKSASAVFQTAEALSISLASPGHGSFIHAGNNSTTFSVAGSCNAAGLPIEVEVDGALSGVAAICDGSSWSATLNSTPLSAGSHTISAVLSDAAGYSASASVGVLKDVIAPQVNGLSNDAISAKTKIWNWSCSEPGCTYRSVIDTNANSSPAGAYSVGVSASQITGTGTYYLHVQARDLAGNESEVVHVSAVLDNAAPVAPSALSLVAPAASPGNVSAPVIRVSGVVSGDLIELYSDAACSLPTLKASGTASAATIDLTSSALGAGSVSFYAKATDPLGNASACSAATLAYVYDNGLPTVTGLENDGTAAKTKSWAWGCSEADCTYRYVVDTNAGTSPAGAYGATTSVLQNTGTATYYVHVQAKDLAGNESEVVHVSAVLDNTVPTQPGAISGAIANGGNWWTSLSQSPSFSWGVSSDAQSGLNRYEVALGTSAGATDLVNWTSTGSATTKQFTGLSLANGSTYHVTVRAVDQAGNLSAVTGSSWVADTGLPTTPGAVNDGITSASTSESPAISWNASTDPVSGISHYEVALGTSAGGNDTLNWISVGNVTSITLNGLALSTGETYYVSVRAIDKAGNVSLVGQGNGWTVTSGGVQSLSIPIVAGADDAYVEYESMGGVWGIVNGGIHAFLGNYGIDESGDWVNLGSALRFQNVQIPKGATITSAKLRVSALHGITPAGIRTKIRAQAADNAAALSTVVEYFARTRTTNEVIFDGFPAFASGQLYDTPDFKAVIQEIVDRGGWASGNSILVFWDDHDGRSNSGANAAFSSYEHDPVKAARLLIEYEAPACTPGTRTFTFTGANQDFVVPAGCSTVQIKLWGAGGGASAFYNGGGGGFVSGTLGVTPGETLTVKVGGAGNSGSGSQGGWPNGGSAGGMHECGAQSSGGGSSSILRVATLLAEAGGGGGAGANDNDWCSWATWSMSGSPGGGTAVCDPSGNQLGTSGDNDQGGGGGGYCGGGVEMGGSSFAPGGGVNTPGSGALAGNRLEAPCSGTCGNSGNHGLVTISYP